VFGRRWTVPSLGWAALLGLLLAWPGPGSLAQENEKTMKDKNEDAGKVDPFKVALEEADFIGVATILSVGKSPGRWSDFALSLQPVKLRIEQVLRGPLKSGAEVEVGYLVVKNSPTADASEPKLNAALFVAGKQVVVFLRKQGEGWTSFDEIYGALPMDQLKTVREHLGL
jgi:hypothetical protein